MTLTHWHPDFAQCPLAWAVDIALTEKGLDYERRAVPYRGAKPPELLALNPRGLTPVLQDGEAVAYELLAVLETIEERHPDPPLLPAAPAARARARSRLHECEAYMLEVDHRLWITMMRAEGDGEPDPQARRLLEEMVEEACLWARRAEEDRWLTGDAYGLVDLLLFPQVVLWRWAGMELGPGLERWYGEVAERPAVKATWVPEPPPSLRKGFLEGRRAAPRPSGAP